jgi:2-keto-4-pentenoate hydratase/2-oxohepta-3-ene-1,7-dioic acid hydratase in catechol pathway
MRTANVDGRAKLIIGDEAVDIASASGGRFGPDPASIYDNWSDLSAWADDLSLAELTREPFVVSLAGPPSPAPRQVFAVALNYTEHAQESGFDAPDNPLIFTKFVSSFSGAVSEVTIPDGNVDWECELVAVISERARRIDPADGWAHVAGLTVGQDISERVLQRSGPAPQFALGKSHAGFSPTGPVLVTPDEFSDPDDLAIGCSVNEEVMQNGRTSQMIFSVPKLVAYLSTIVTLLPGDVIFTGTPPGVGMGRNPKVFLHAGDHLVSHIEGIGELSQHFVA